MSQAMAPPTPTVPTASQTPETQRPQGAGVGAGVDAARGTLVTALATCAAALPLVTIFSDSRWLLDVWTCVLLVLLPAAALRMSRRGTVVALLPGLVCAIGYLTMRFLPEHAIAGVIPTVGTASDLAELARSLGVYVRTTSAPSSADPAAIFVICLVFLALALLSDLLIVSARSGAHLALPYLLILVVSASIPRHYVPSWAFAALAVAYALVLANDTHPQLRDWGPLLPVGAPKRRALLSGTGVGVCAGALIAALMLASLLPATGRNSLTDAVRKSSGKSAGGSGALDPFASLRGQLTKAAAIPLLTVHVAAGTNPYYLRQVVLDDFTGSRWQQSTVTSSYNLSPDLMLSTLPDEQPALTSESDLDVAITGLTGPAPVVASPVSVRGLPSGTTWLPRTGTLAGREVSSGARYSLRIAAPAPSATELAAARELAPAVARELAADLQLPRDLPRSITTTTSQITADAQGPWAIAQSLQKYFTSPDNGFSYSLTTKLGDSGNDLVDFLANKQGYCQQFAAAMAVMLRASGVPARVVLGYTHAAPDKGGNFEVLSSNAHAWVEAYFAGVGWTAFDPTPESDVTGSQSLPYLPGQTEATAPQATEAPRPGSTERPTPVPSPGRTTDRTADVAAAPAAHSRDGVLLAGASMIIGALLLVCAPAALRAWRRRRRIRAAKRLGVEALWQELVATANDVGYVWAPSRTPRQISGQLAEAIGDENARAAIESLCVALEHDRYVPVSADGRSAASEDRPERLVADLRSASTALRASVDRRTRIRALLLPASVCWWRRDG